MLTKLSHAYPRNASQQEASLSRISMPIPRRAEGNNLASILVVHLDGNGQEAIAVGPQLRGFYQLLWVMEGSGTYSGSETNYAIAPGVLLLLVPGQAHALQLTTRLRGTSILFTSDSLRSTECNQEDFFTTLFYADMQSLILTLLPAETGQVQHIIERLEYEFRSQLPGQQMVLQAYLCILLTTISRLACPRLVVRGTTLPPLVLAFLDLLERHLYSKRLVSEYADLLAITPGHLNDLVKQSLGKTAGEVLREAVLLEAKRMLLSSQTSVAEIAQRFAFDDPSYFCRFFRRSTGQSPKAFQRAMQQAR